MFNEYLLTYLFRNDTKYIWRNRGVIMNFDEIETLLTTLTFIKETLKE